LKNEKNLFSKKESLFKAGNTLKWELSPEDAKRYDKSILTSKKELAFKVICSKVNSD
jgi:hypothetical protein